MTFVSWITGAEDHIWSLGMTPDELHQFCKTPHRELGYHGVRMYDHLVVTFTPVREDEFESLIGGVIKNPEMSPAQGMLIRDLAQDPERGEIYFAYGIAETGFASIVGPPRGPASLLTIPRANAGRIDFDQRKPNLGFMHGELPNDWDEIGKMIYSAITMPERWTNMLEVLSMPVFDTRPDGSVSQRAPLEKIMPHPYRRVVFEHQLPQPAGCHNGLIVNDNGIHMLVDQIFKLW